MKPIRHTRAAGFSLVETVLAIGIMGLAITALLGLLPHGIEMTRQAGNENAIARILDTVHTELMRMPYDTVHTLADGERLSFDEQGVLIAGGGGGAGISAQAFLVQVDYRGVADNAIQLTGAVGAEPQVKNFAVQVASTGLSDFNFNSRSTKSFRTFPILVGPNFITTN
jgi:uncharacterized protein (TIGR02598 family)